MPENKQLTNIKKMSNIFKLCLVNFKYISYSFLSAAFNTTKYFWPEGGCSTFLCNWDLAPAEELL